MPQLVSDCTSCGEMHTKFAYCIRGQKKCPGCGETKDIPEGFGFRLRQNFDKHGYPTGPARIRPQSHCRKCRGKKGNREDVIVKLAIGVDLANGTDKSVIAFTNGSSMIVENGKTTELRGKTIANFMHLSETGALYTRETLKKAYREAYPGDKAGNARAFKFMANRLGKKLGIVIVEAP